MLKPTKRQARIIELMQAMSVMRDGTMRHALELRLYKLVTKKEARTK